MTCGHLHCECGQGTGPKAGREVKEAGERQSRGERARATPRPPLPLMWNHTRAGRGEGGGQTMVPCNWMDGTEASDPHSSGGVT